ncbi:hypothetical protein [Nonomuraea sp. NPDC049758]|uniref:hypothetical protein n=1 Tax=Nonomuraea sp. NPDC049758 TaxID=3154360 RepID=UPI00343D3252
MGGADRRASDRRRGRDGLGGIAGRAVQGVGGALVAPAATPLLVVLFGNDSRGFRAACPGTAVVAGRRATLAAPLRRQRSVRETVS